MKPKSEVWKYGVVLMAFSFVILLLSAQAYGYPSRGIEIKTQVNLENAAQGLSEENREFIFGVHEFLEGSKFKGVLYRSHCDPSVGVLLTEKYVLMSLEKDDNRNPSNIDWKSIVNDELKWLNFMEATEISVDDITEIVSVTKCCGCVEKVEGKFIWRTIKGDDNNDKSLNLSGLKIPPDGNIADKSDILLSTIVVITICSVALVSYLIYKKKSLKEVKNAKRFK